jgi:peptide deformylase
VVRTVLLEGNPLVRKKMPDIDTDDKAKIKQVLTDLRDTMFETDSIGFAANQIGEPFNICIVRVFSKYMTDKDKVLTFVNPTIVFAQGSKLAKEGCRSIPDYWAFVPRSTTIIIQHLNGPTKLMAWQARIAQHEIDHLNGILISDYVDEINGRSGGVEIEAWRHS